VEFLEMEGNTHIDVDRDDWRQRLEAGDSEVEKA